MSSCNTVMESFAVRVTRDVYLSETVDALIVSFRLHFFCIDYSAGGGDDWRNDCVLWGQVVWVCHPLKFDHNFIK